MMSWVVFGLLTAFFESIKDFTSKRSGAALGAFTLAFANTLFALPIFASGLMRAEVPTLTAPLLFFLSLDGILHILALVLYMRAITISPLSITLPLIALTPLFMLLTSPLMIGEWPSLLGGCGVLFIVCGVYLLNIDQRSVGLFEPFRVLLREEGSRCMLLVAFLYSITGNIDRFGIRLSSRPVWMFLLLLVIALGLLPFSLREIRSKKSKFREVAQNGFFPGVANGLSLYFYMQGISITLVAYIVSVKRLSILFGVMLGYLFLGETNIRARLRGTLVMLLGVLLIALGA